MAFGIGTNTEKPDSGKIKGVQEDIACDCWFSSTGKAIPRFIKYQDKDGVIHSIYDIQVITAEDKHFCGIKSREYKCRAQKDGYEYFFRLIFWQEECRWKLCWD